MVKNNIKLEHLDLYAKRLSAKQMNRLYESKLNKTYQKRLFEDGVATVEVPEETEEVYSVYFSNFTMMMNELNEQDVAEYAFDGVEIKADEEGFLLFTSDMNRFIELLASLKPYAEYLRETIHPDYQQYID